jgi:hypothetical protein
VNQPEVTCILTSCGRFDLLRITLESFFKHNTYDIKEFIIYEDGGFGMPGRAIDYPMIKFIHRTTEHKNQITALDTLWGMVTTPYAFTMEDDWEFLQPGFIEASMKVLEQCPNVLQCWLNTDPTNVQPIEWITDEYGIFKTSGGLWSGTRFNPALKRKADYDLIAPFSQHTEWNPAKPWKSESDISKEYFRLGFKGAKLSKDYIRHIGEGRHVGV